MILTQEKNIFFVEGRDVYPRKDLLKHIGFGFDHEMKLGNKKRWFFDNYKNSPEVCTYIFNMLQTNDIQVKLGNGINDNDCKIIKQDALVALRKKLISQDVIYLNPPFFEPKKDTSNVVHASPAGPEPPTPQPSRTSKNIKEVHIFFRHLNPAGKAVLMAEFAIKDPKELGWDENPIAILVQKTTVKQKA